MTQGFTYTTQDIDEDVLSYNTGQSVVPAELAAPAWQVIGGFSVTLDTPARLEVTGLVSNAGLVMSTRLFRVTAPAGPIVPSVTITSDAVITAFMASPVTLEGGVEYQVQSQVIGADGELDFGTIHTAKIV